MVKLIRTLATRPFPFIPPPSLFVTFIYFWLCTLVFSSGEAVGNMISGPVHPFLFHNFLACYRCHRSCSMMQVVDQGLFPPKRDNTQYVESLKI